MTPKNPNNRLFSENWKKYFNSREWWLMIECFFDDSGKESWIQETHVCIAGYLGNNSLWDGFLPQWEGMLLRNHISCIHMKDLIHLEGEYKKLGWNIEKRDIVLSECIDIIKRNKLIGFGVGVDVSGWKEIPKTLRKKYANGKVQDFCFARLMGAVVQTVTDLKANDLVHIVFDTDRDFAKARFELFSRIRAFDKNMRESIPMITFADPKIVRPLQAADLLAWETRKEMIQKSQGYKSTPRYQALIDGLSQFALDYTRELFGPKELKSLFERLERRSK